MPDRQAPSTINDSRPELPGLIQSDQPLDILMIHQSGFGMGSKLQRQTAHLIGKRPGKRLAIFPCQGFEAGGLGISAGAGRKSAGDCSARVSFMPLLMSSSSPDPNDERAIRLIYVPY